MFIKSIVLDGFKSYGNRVEIKGFDPEFNAITGLNGTGKSNILDSICFVLGITNLSNVRAGSLQELIYKHGQAGITKATVSITFDNTNKAQQPIGYDSKEITVTRQVVMGGKNKYMINGNNVQNKRVIDLFCSVQLNVNNPHFLIMQGRITKVLNMKPPEILSMVEEAAGTRMYEAKKQAAERIIEKKDNKLKELNDMIQEVITPRLQKLQDERSQFQEYQKVVREQENLTKLFVAWKYVCAEEKTKEADAKVTAVKDQITSSRDTIKKNKDEMKAIQENIEQLNNVISQESGNTLKDLEHELTEAEREEAGAGAALQAARDALTAHDKRVKALEKALKQDEAALKLKKEQEEKMRASFSDVQAAHEQSAAALEAATRKFLAVSGLEGDAGTLQDQLMAAKKEASEAGTRVSQATLEQRAASGRLRSLQDEFRTSAAHYQRDRDTIHSHRRQIDALQAEISAMQFSEERHASFQQRVRELQTNVRRARDTADSLSARLQRCDFKYRAPTQDFDHKRVSGTVCRLFDVKDPIYCTAVETAAGGKLYNVVVDTEETSKLLLQRGGLTTRTTIIPLNKIRAYTIDRQTLAAAQAIGGGPDNVQLALELVTFPREVHSAMAWVLGNTLVCRDLETAKRVTFDPRVKRRSVTLDGDVFDPSGTLSGGAAIKGGSVLLQLQELRQLQRQLRDTEAELADTSAQLKAEQHRADSYHALKQKYEMMSHELEATSSRLATTSHGRLNAEIEALQEQLETLSASIAKDKEIQSKNAALAKDLESKVKDIKGHREREFKKAKEELDAAKRAAEQHGAAWGAREQQTEELRLEVLEHEQAAASAREQRDREHAARPALDAARDSAQEEHSRILGAVKDIQNRIKRQKEEIASRSGEIRRLAAKKEELSKANRDTELHIKELDFKIKELQTEADECQKKMSSLVSEHAWITAEREYFGAAGGLYDFEGRQASAAGARLQQLAAKKDKLSRGLNARAHTLLSKEEDIYQELMRKKKIVEMDRAKLVQTITQMDEKKRQTLVAACEQVTKDFGSIFATLLPGAHARLRPPHGHTVLDGLEVSVGFNGTWKESLGELSGGQRSLVALSLVLALLLFKPAPLYILDEVDAALDLSHTQNIGLMLKEHFRHSQFIIVSLKDGMFNNANVLFRTRFVDGMSSVQRTVNTNRT